MFVKSPGQAGPIEPNTQAQPVNYQQEMLDGLSKGVQSLAEGGRFSLYFKAEDKTHLDALLDAAQKVGQEAAKRWPDLTPNLRLIHGNEVVVSLLHTKDPARIKMLKGGIE
jgi:hypothetical protein